MQAKKLHARNGYERWQRTHQSQCLRPLRRCWTIVPRFALCNNIRSALSRTLAGSVLEPVCLSAGFLGAFFILWRVSHFPNLWARKYQRFCTLLPAVAWSARCAPGQESFNRYDGKSTSESSSFTVLVVSDVQYDWYDGEYYDLVTPPSACSELNVASFRECKTEDIAEPVQQQQMKAFAALVGDRREALLDNDPTGWQWTRPDTILLNGDLTAYFHPWRRSYF